MNNETALLGIRGHLFDTPVRGQLRARNNGALIIENGRLIEVGDYEIMRKKAREKKVRWLHSANVAVFPGLIDVHSHVPQYPAIARGQTELLPWLRQHIFPREREFTGPKAKKEATQFFRELARHGTTTAMLYTAIFQDSCEAAFQAAQKTGLRAIIGKMMMDVGSYGSLQPKKILSISLLESEQLCKKWHGANDGLLHYAFSPRFAVSCTDRMMRGAAEMAKQYGAYVETHLSENLHELEMVRHLFPQAQDYTDVYDQCGLLGPKTMLGHCIHLSERELDVLAERGSSVAHCPTANFFLSSGIMPLDKMLAKGIRVGLGTDVAAGLELNLWQVMRTVIEAQKARSFYEKDVLVPTIADALYHATQGGATALGLSDKIGTLEVGKEADLTVMDFHSLMPYPKQAKAADLSADDILSLCIYRGGPAAVVETFVRGESVYRAVEPELF
jgi:guanine deaminase